jgi:hypothetical protein
MTPKEKADELHVGYWHLTNDSRIAKQCALIAVDEIINVTVGLNGWIDGFQYWEEVKKEIETQQ